MTRRDVEFQIDELVLNGIPSVDGLDVAAAVESEIARLLTTRGLPLDGPRDVSTTQAEPIDSSSLLSAGEMGRQVGRSIYGGLHHEQ